MPWGKALLPPRTGKPPAGRSPRAGEDDRVGRSLRHQKGRAPRAGRKFGERGRRVRRHSPDPARWGKMQELAIPTGLTHTQPRAQGEDSGKRSRAMVAESPGPTRRGKFLSQHLVTVVVQTRPRAQRKSPVTLNDTTITPDPVPRAGEKLRRRDVRDVLRRRVRRERARVEKDIPDAERKLSARLTRRGAYGRRRRPAGRRGRRGGCGSSSLRRRGRRSPA